MEDARNASGSGRVRINDATGGAHVTFNALSAWP